MAKNKAKGGAQQKGRILSDHQRVGKKFIPPMQQLGPWKDANWVGSILPEFLWLGLLNAHHGKRDGAALALSLARAATDVTGPNPSGSIPQGPMPKFAKPPVRWFATTDSYTSLNEEQQSEVVRYLEASGQLEDIAEALNPLIAFYPDCPLRFLYKGIIPVENKDRLEWFKTVLAELFDKYDTPATFVLANAIYIAFVTNKLKVMKGSMLSKFPAVEDFPRTEESRHVAASIRASVNVLWGNEKPSDWPGYFWNRGLAIETCDYERIYEAYE